jgi:hypothetical protein
MSSELKVESMGDLLQKIFRLQIANSEFRVEALILGIYKSGSCRQRIARNLKGCHLKNCLVYNVSYTGILP